MPKLKKIIADTFKAVGNKIDPHRRLHGFEVYGYDFMLDEDFNISLIEVNTNPSLEIPCPLLSRILFSLLDNAFR
jgi:D-alanine-D-alanine ligase-like ATP-grasp enzyme